MHVTFIPNLREHVRATSALGRIARIYDPVAALPLLCFCLVVARVIVQAGSSPTLPGALAASWPLMFVAGIGMRARVGKRDALSYDLGPERIEVRQRRRRWAIEWSRVARVEETGEFFLVAADRFAFYLPKRAVDGDDGVIALRAVLQRRGGPDEG
jgi:hypothetical protein